MLSVIVYALLLTHASDPITLTRPLKVGDSEAYTVKMVNKQIISMPNGMGDQDMDMVNEMLLEFKTTAVDEKSGTADVKFKTTVTKMEMSGPMGGNSAPTTPAVEISAKVDRLNRLTYDMGAAMSKAGLAMTNGSTGGTSTMGLFIELPDHAVSVGDSWDVKIPKNMMMGDADQIMKAKLVAINPTPTGDVAVIHLSGTLKLQVDMSKFAGEGAPAQMASMKMKLNGTMSLDGEGNLDVKTGRTLNMKSSIKSDITMNIEQLGQPLHMTGDMVVTSALKS